MLRIDVIIITTCSFTALMVSTRGFTVRQAVVTVCVMLGSRYQITSKFYNYAIVFTLQRLFCSFSDSLWAGNSKMKIYVYQSVTVKLVEWRIRISAYTWQEAFLAWFLAIKSANYMSICSQTRALPQLHFYVKILASTVEQKLCASSS